MLLSYRKTAVFCGKGKGRDRFQTSLFGLTVTPDGRLYVVGDRQVKVFDSAGGKLLGQWPTERPGRCVAVAPDGRVWVGEAGQIELFDVEGRRLDRWQDKTLLSLVTSVGFFGEFVFVGDAGARAIRRFSKQREHQLDIGTDTNMRGFAIPNGQLDFALDKQGRLFVAHSGKHRVEWYSLDGELLGRFGHFGMRDPADFRGCCNPTNIALTPDEQVVVTEKAGPRVKVYDLNGRLLALVGERFFHPNCKNMDVAVASDGRLFVADTVRLHVLVFAPEEQPADSAKERTNTHEHVK